VAARGENGREGCEFPSLVKQLGSSSWLFLIMSGVSSQSSRPNPINMVIFSCSYRYIDNISFSFINPQLLVGVTRGARGAQFPRPRITMGAPNHVTNTCFNTVHLLPKDLRFEHGGAKLASCPGRHVTSIRPCPKPKA